MKRYDFKRQGVEIDDVMEALYSGQWRAVTRIEQRYALIAFAETGRQQCAAQAADVTISVLARWQKDDKVFGDAWEEARVSRLGHYEDIVAERAEGGECDSFSGRSVEIMLERFDPKHYGKQRIEHTGAVPTRVEIVDESE